MGLNLNSSREKTSGIKESSNVEPYENARRLSVLRRQRKVLIIDDESTGRTILAKIIQQAEDDVSVKSFDDPLQALNWLDTNHPDFNHYRLPNAGN